MNDYTAFLSIKIKQHADGKRFDLKEFMRRILCIDEWHVLLNRYRLMDSPHGELGSNTHVILDQKEVIINFHFLSSKFLDY